MYHLLPDPKLELKILILLHSQQNNLQKTLHRVYGAWFLTAPNLSDELVTTVCNWSCQEQIPEDIVLHDHSVITMRTVDTDWIMIAPTQFHFFTPELEDLHVEFGTGKNYRQVYILCKTINITQFLLSDLNFNTV